MILDLDRFITSERKYWEELDSVLTRLEADPRACLRLDDALRLHYLFQRCAADLAKVQALAGEEDLRQYLEALVARAYGETQQSKRQPARQSLWSWFTREFPATFRRRIAAFQVSLGVTVLGVLFGAGAILLDPDSKPALMPFGALLEDPAARVAREEKAGNERLAGRQGSFSAELMTHNTRVSVFTMALGVTWGIGSVILLFYNGATVGAVAADYINAHYSGFLFGWLLPHGSIEIPAILIAGQAGLVLASALIGRRKRERLRAVSKDIVTLICGTAVLLVWAGIVEAFFSQYHEPVIPYALKIAFGVVQLTALTVFLTRAGHGSSRAFPRQ